MDTNKGMTIKEIAEVCGVDERTIRRWIDGASGKTPDDPGNLPGLSAKTAEAQESKVPARFSLDEVIAIIRGGGRATLADLLADNAARAAALSAPAVPAVFDAQNAAVDLYRDVIAQQRSLIQNQAVVIDVLTREIQHLRRTAAARIVSGILPAESTEDGEWITTTELSTIYGKTRATTLSHARARGWPMRSGQLENGAFTFEFLVSGLPQKLQDAWKARKESNAENKEAADAQ
jgi:hypothetical protein